MDLLRKLFARKSAPEQDPKPPTAPQPQPADINAAGVLLELAQRRDIDQVLRGLDAHLERIQEQGREAEAVRLLRWAEEELHQEPSPQPAQYALLGNICQRLTAEQATDPHLKALGFYATALEGFQLAQEMEGMAVVQNNMGLAYLGLAQRDAQYFRAAVPLLEESLQFYERGDDWPRRADICLSLGDAYVGLEEPGSDHFELGREYLERARALYERCGDLPRQAQAQGQLGDVQMELALYDPGPSLEKAVRHYRNALALYVDLDDALGTARYQDCLSRAYGSLGEEEHLRKSLRAGQRARELYEEHGRESSLAGVCHGLGQVHLELVRLGADEELLPAFEQLRRALGLYLDLGDRMGRAQCLLGLAEIYLGGEAQQQDADRRQGLSCLEEALAIYRLEGHNAAAADVERQLDPARRADGSAG